MTRNQRIGMGLMAWGLYVAAHVIIGNIWRESMRTPLDLVAGMLVSYGFVMLTGKD